jgi:hypothetical protein
VIFLLAYKVSLVLSAQIKREHKIKKVDYPLKKNSKRPRGRYFNLINFLVPKKIVLFHKAQSFAMVAFFVIALGEQHEARHILPKISPIQ